MEMIEELPSRNCHLQHDQAGAGKGVRPGVLWFIIVVGGVALALLTVRFWQVG
jgi:hypothetical protein